MKSTRRFFQAVGIWVAVMPFLHFPVTVRNILYVITGITIFITAYLYLRKRASIIKEKIEPTFVESVPDRNTAKPSEVVTNESIETIE
ncbi:MAG: hypothetical protein RL641_192 [Candidatus Parcubacteria bacterium]|jgi:hypothetical protein